MTDTPESSWTPVAELEIVSGRLAVADPMHCREPDGVVVDVQPGTYAVLASVGDHGIVSRMRVSPRGVQPSRGVQLGEVGVDFAQVGAFDPSIVDDVLSAMTFEESEALLDEMEVTPFGVSHYDRSGRGTMPFVTSGRGDGTYPAYALMDRGVPVGVEVVFVGPEVDGETPGSPSA